MQRAMARQAEAEREKRAKIIHASGEYEAAKTLAEAARIIGSEPTAIQLRYLQTLTEIASERNSTIIFPIPIELISLIPNVLARRDGAAAGPRLPESSPTFDTLPVGGSHLPETAQTGPEGEPQADVPARGSRPPVGEDQLREYAEEKARFMEGDIHTSRDEEPPERK
jgi:hypothetical protein